MKRWTLTLLVALFASGQALADAPSHDAVTSDAVTGDATPQDKQDTDADLLPECSLDITKEVTPVISSPLAPGSVGCKVALWVDARGRVSNVEDVDCAGPALEEARPALERWRFERNACPEDEEVRFPLTLESNSVTQLIPQTPATVGERIGVANPNDCVLAFTLLPSGEVESVRSSDPDRCVVHPGAAGWNPARFWRREITGLHCTARFDADEGSANDVRFEGCGGPSRMALVSFVERATWGADLPESTAFEVHFRLRDDGAEPVDRAAEQARLIRQPCDPVTAPERLARRTHIPAMPSRWALDRSDMAAYCRLRVHLSAEALPERIDAVLCGDVFAPRAASAVARWRFEAPRCGDTPVASEVVVLVPFAQRLRDGSLLNPTSGDRMVDLAHEIQGIIGLPKQPTCVMNVDLPNSGRVRIYTSDRRRCFVTPTSIPTLPKRELRQWADATDESVMRCQASFDVRTTRVDNLQLTGCTHKAADRARRAVEQWSWSVLGRRTEHYDVSFRFRLD